MEELLVVEPIVACRLFQLRGYANLCGVSFYTYTWSAGINIADCRTFRPCRVVPDFYCTCGLYAFKNVKCLNRGYMIDARVALAAHVLGEVELTGKVIEHNYGYRAEKARIKALICNGQANYKDVLKHIRRAADHYEVPLLDYDDWREAR